MPRRSWAIRRLAKAQQHVASSRVLEINGDAALAAKKTTAEWIDAFERADLPAMPMHTLDSLLKDPHLRESGFFRLVDHPTEGRIVSMAVPSKWSKTVPANSRHAPNLGEHTTEVLSQAGYTGAEIEELLTAKAVFRTSI